MRRLIRVGPTRHAVHVAGEGSPTVVLEPGIGDVAATWGLVLPHVGEGALAIARDRPGLGDSDPVAGTRSAEEMGTELGEVLEEMGARPPYVLVGHSFASLVVRWFAHGHADEIAGIVLVDGAHEDQMERFPPELDPRPLLDGFVGRLREMEAEARRGAEIPELAPVPAGFPPEPAEAYRVAVTPTPSRLDTIAREYAGLAQSQAQVRALDWGPLRDVPLVALRHGVPQPVPGVADDVNHRYEEVWRELQGELAARSARGAVVEVEGAGHMIHHERPEAVVEAVARISSRGVRDPDGQSGRGSGRKRARP